MLLHVLNFLKYLFEPFLASSVARLDSDVQNCWGGGGGGVGFGMPSGLQVLQGYK